MSTSKISLSTSNYVRVNVGYGPIIIEANEGEVRVAVTPNQPALSNSAYHRVTDRQRFEVTPDENVWVLANTSVQKAVSNATTVSAVSGEAASGEKGALGTVNESLTVGTTASGSQIQNLSGSTTLSVATNPIATGQKATSNATSLTVGSALATIGEVLKDFAGTTSLTISHALTSVGEILKDFTGTASNSHASSTTTQGTKSVAGITALTAVLSDTASGVGSVDSKSGSTSLAVSSSPTSSGTKGGVGATSITPPTGGNGGIIKLVSTVFG